MGTRTTVTTFDDLDGGTDDVETIALSFDGTSVKIDLGEANYDNGESHRPLPQGWPQDHRQAGPAPHRAPALRGHPGTHLRIRPAAVRRRSAVALPALAIRRNGRLRYRATPR